MIKRLWKKLFKKEEKVKDEDIIKALTTKLKTEDMPLRSCTSEQADKDIEIVLLKYLRQGYALQIRLKSSEDFYFNC